ncbi:hypothetical protein GQ55_3G101800 [Panicum hallii var. hallii]|uniref:Uncharacterized protein n=3 Tax=Panicum hallii TaxID=206008 RepID=A0A2T7E7R8_9POAL|nr:hypothetical protein GQ55_3G101800 [Panicum hallii var. hallii]
MYTDLCFQDLASNMASDDPVDDENPTSHTNNNISSDNKNEQMSRVVSSHDQYTRTVFDFVHTDKTTTKSSRQPRLQGQASVAAPA